MPTSHIHNKTKAAVAANAITKTIAFAPTAAMTNAKAKTKTSGYYYYYYDDYYEYY
jgi:hypothetical protein